MDNHREILMTNMPPIRWIASILVSLLAVGHAQQPDIGVPVRPLGSGPFVFDTAEQHKIRVSVVVHQSGRFAGNVTGEQTDPSGSSTTIFESTNEPESQRQVSGGEAFTYAFPLKVLDPGRADNVQITLYLFKAPSGPATDDIAKVFMKSPKQEDDGQFFYGALPTPSQAGN